MANINIPDDLVSKYSEDVKDLTQKAGSIPSSKSLIPQTAFTPDELRRSLKFWQVTTKVAATVASDWTNLATALTNGTFSATHLRTLCELAFNLKAPTGTGTIFIHEIADPWKGCIDANAPDTVAIPATDSDVNMSTVSSGSTASGTEDAEVKMKAISFLCCTLLRLSVKEPSHIMQAINSIRQRFGSLYGVSSPTLNSVTFNRSQLSRIKQGIETYPSARGTVFYYTRYADVTHGYTTKEYGICRFLLFQHLELEGMHIYKMLLALLGEWSTVPIGLLLTWIRNPRSKLAINEIVKIVKELDKPEVDKGWKYARMVNNTFFLDLSSRRNTYLCAVLASLNKKNVPQGSGEYADPTNIAVIKNMDQSVKSQVATDVTLIERIYEKYLVSAGGDEAGTAYALSRGVKRSSPQSQEGGQSGQSGGTPMEVDGASGRGAAGPAPKKTRSGL
uniref:Nucleoprotein n=1 Tax=Maize mosaic virus TaxID=279896 RepID=A0A4P8XEC3_MMV|nr:nucleoprotein [Maize mosaic nucleorhabdovirus]